MKSPSLVLVEWEDSAQPMAAWQYLAELDLPEVVRCQSVDFFIYDGDDVKALAPNVGDHCGEYARHRR